MVNYQSGFLPSIKVNKEESPGRALVQALDKFSAAVDSYGKGKADEYTAITTAEAEQAARIDSFKTYQEAVDSGQIDKTKSKYWVSVYDNVKGQQQGLAFNTTKQVAFQEWWAGNSANDDLDGSLYNKWSSEFDQKYFKEKVGNVSTYFLKGLENYVKASNQQIGTSYASYNTQKLKINAENNLINILENKIQLDDSLEQISTFENFNNETKFIDRNRFDELVVQGYKNQIAKVAQLGDPNADYNKAEKLVNDLSKYTRPNGSKILKGKDIAEWENFKQNLNSEKVQHQERMFKISQDAEFNNFATEQQKILSTKFAPDNITKAGETEGRQKAAFATDEYKQRVQNYQLVNPNASIEEKKNFAVDTRVLIENKYEDAEISKLRAYSTRNPYNVQRAVNDINYAMQLLKKDVEALPDKNGYKKPIDENNPAYKFLFNGARLNGFITKDGKPDVGAFYNSYINAVQPK
jgi:hypothetical protein